MSVAVTVNGNRVVVRQGGPPGPAGPPGSGTGADYTVTEIVGALKVVKATGNGTVGLAQPSDTAPVLGVTQTAGTTIGNTVTVLQLGEIQDALWNWTLGSPVVLGANGALTQDLTGITRITVIGYPVAADSLYVRIQPTVTVL